jgi:hypothetical protein
MLSITERGGMCQVRNETDGLKIEVGEEIDEGRRGLRSAYSSIGAPFGMGGRDFQSLKLNKGASN